MQSDTQRSDWGGLWGLTRGQRARYGGAVAAIALANVCMLGAPVVAGHALDVIKEGHLAPALSSLAWVTLRIADSGQVAAYLAVSAAAAVLVTAAGGLLMYVRGRWAALASEGLARRVRDSLYERLHELPAAFFDHADTGDLVQRCSSDVETVRLFLSSQVVEIGRAVLLVAVMAPVLFLTHPALAALGVSLMPVLVAGAVVFFSRVRRRFQIADEAEGAMTAVLQENLTGIRVVRAFARQQHEMARFGAKSRAWRDNVLQVTRLEAVYWGLSDFLCLSQIGVVLIAGGLFLAAGKISVGELFVFVSLVSQVIWPVRRLGEVLTDSGKAIVALGRVNHILQAAPESRAPPPPVRRAKGAIVFDAVRAGYKPDRAAVVDFSVRIPAGQTVGIVGPPGCGKSTLVRLLLRLYPIHGGRILVDGMDVRELDRRWLRDQIGVVMQEPFLYARSIADNLRVGRPDAADDELSAAAREAAIDDAIAELPAGYETRVGERGVTLSGGQRQRLALARALLKNPPILVLDDSLSAVDSGTEQRILGALARRRGRHTTLVIAHRISSVRDADRILVLDRGRLLQDGVHDDLAAMPGPYRRLCEVQGLFQQRAAHASGQPGAKGAARG